MRFHVISKAAFTLKLGLAVFADQFQPRLGLCLFLLVIIEMNSEIMSSGETFRAKMANVAFLPRVNRVVNLQRVSRAEGPFAD